jgi:hypothetical protein
LNKNIDFSYHRDASFDYCYNYFNLSTKDDISNDLEKGCLVIYYYLASWGMLRNSFLLNKSWKHFLPLLKYLAEKKSEDTRPWSIDVNSYNEENIEILKEVYNDIKKLVIPFKKEKIEYTHLTLITKIMLGIFGNIPAFDTYFVLSLKTMFPKECGFTVVNEQSLNCIKKFYLANENDINNLSSNKYTIDILSEGTTTLNYTKAKIIDLYGFCDGVKIAEAEAYKKKQAAIQSL